MFPRHPMVYSWGIFSNSLKSKKKFRRSARALMDQIRWTEFHLFIYYFFFFGGKKQSGRFILAYFCFMSKKSRFTRARKPMHRAIVKRYTLKLFNSRGKTRKRVKDGKRKRKSEKFKSPKKKAKQTKRGRDLKIPAAPWTLGDLVWWVFFFHFFSWPPWVRFRDYIKRRRRRRETFRRSRQVRFNTL